MRLLSLEPDDLQTASSITFWTQRFFQLARELSVARLNKRKRDSLGTDASAVKRPRIIHPMKQRTPTVNQVNNAVSKVITPVEGQVTQLRGANESRPPKEGGTAPAVYGSENAAAPTTSITSEASPGTSVQRTNLTEADSFQALVDTRTTSVPITAENMNSGENDNNVGDTTIGRDSVPHSQPRDEVTTKAGPAPTNGHPLAESGQQIKAIMKEASPALTALHREPDRADRITSEGAPTSVEILGVPEVAQERAMDESQTTPTANTVRGQDSILDGSEVITNPSKPNTILSHRLGHLAIPGAVIALPEVLDDIIEVLPKP